MPIFIKNNYSIYFSHIPKTAGSSIYVAFAESGWSIFNVQKRLSPDSTYSILSNRFGIDSSKSLISIKPHRFSIHHALFKNWSKWYTPDESFSIIRDPVERYRSAILYQYPRLNRKFKSPQSYSSFIISILKYIPYSAYFISDYHFLPQCKFVDQSTKLFLYSSNWQQELVKHYDIQNVPWINQSSRKLDFTLSNADLDFLRSFYKHDYALISRCSSL